LNDDWFLKFLNCLPKILKTI